MNTVAPCPVASERKPSLVPWAKNFRPRAWTLRSWASCTEDMRAEGGKVRLCVVPVPTR